MWIFLFKFRIINYARLTMKGSNCFRKIRRGRFFEQRLSGYVKNVLNDSNLRDPWRIMSFYSVDVSTVAWTVRKVLKDLQQQTINDSNSG